MDETIVEQLSELGLSEKEARVYMALLPFENASVQQVATESSLNRSTTYVLLASLREKGFVQENVVGNKRTYTAEEPSSLLTKATTAVEEHGAVHSAMTETSQKLGNLLHTQLGTPHAIFVDTLEGIRALRREAALAATKTKVCGYSHRTPDTPFLESAVDLRLLMDSSSGANKNIRTVPDDCYPFTSDFFLFNETIILISEAEEFAVRIDSADFSKVLHETFNLAWAEAAQILKAG